MAMSNHDPDEHEQPTGRRPGDGDGGPSMLRPYVDYVAGIKARLETKFLAGPVGRAYVGDRWLERCIPQSSTSMSTLPAGGSRCGHGGSPGLDPIGGLLAALFSRRLQQLNLPRDALDVSKGMTSDVTSVLGPDRSHLGTAWQRTLRSNGNAVFGGFYGIAELPKESAPAVRVGFHLPDGSITVFLRPENAPGGALRLVSNGRDWDEIGAYLVVDHGGRKWARRVQLPERFDIYLDEEGVLRADHRLDFWNWPVLRMHYRLERLPS